MRDASSLAAQPLARRGVAACVALCGLLVAGRRMSGATWTSDDVAWQVAFRTWRPGASTLYLPDNTYVLHWPLLVLGDLLLPDRPLQLFLLSALLNAAGLLLVLRFVRWAMADVLDRPLGVVDELAAAAAVAAVLVANSTVGFTNAGLTSRGLEAGVSLAAIQLMVEVWRGDRRVSGPGRAGAAVVAVALLGLNDPLFVYSIVVPGAAVFAWSAVRGRRRDAATAAGVLLLGIVGWQLGRWILRAVGVQQVSIDHDPKLSNLIEHLPILRDVVLAGVGLRPRDASEVVGNVLQALVGAVVVVFVLWAVLRCRRALGVALLPLVWLAVLSLAFLASSVAEFGAGRYVLYGIGALAPLVAIGVRSLGRSGVVAVALAAFAVGTAFADLVSVRSGTEAAEPLQLASTLESLASEGYDVVLAGFWSTAITRYYGDGLDIRPVVCGGSTLEYRWLVDDSVFDSAAPSDRATGSVVAVDRELGIGPCSDPTEQFGAPTRVEVVGRHDLFLYDGDVSAAVRSPDD